MQKTKGNYNLIKENPSSTLFNEKEMFMDFQNQPWAQH